MKNCLITYNVYLWLKPNRAVDMVKRGADTIAFASCITRGNPIGFACPNAEKIIEATKKKLGEHIKIIEYTY